MKIGLAYNLKANVFPLGELDSEQVEEFDSLQTIDAVCSVFEDNGFKTVRLGGDINIIDKIKREKPGFVFNMAEGYWGRNREAHIPAILELMGIPYSGSDPLTLAVTLDKITTKKILRQMGILTPSFSVIKKWDDLINLEGRLNYPLVVKPAWEGSSKGVYAGSKANDKSALARNVEILFSKYPEQPVLAEEFIIGREITAAVIGNDPPKVFNLMEINTKKGNRDDFIYSLEMKRNWKEEAEYVISPDLGKLIEKSLRGIAIAVFIEFDCRDVARIDFRIDNRGRIYLLEINPLPGLAIGYSDLVIMAERSGMKYGELIISILSSAFRRYGIITDLPKLTEAI